MIYLINTTIYIIIQSKWNLLINSKKRINFNVGANYKGLIFNVGHHTRIPKYKNTFGKGYAPD